MVKGLYAANILTDCLQHVATTVAVAEAAAALRRPIACRSGRGRLGLGAPS